MEPVTRTPTEPVDYALLSATYGSLLTALIITSRDRAAPAPHELPVLGLATFALAKLISKEKVETWVRMPFVDEERRKPRGTRLRYAVGELLTCSRCMGAWSALGIIGLRMQVPHAGRVFSLVMAASALNDWLQSGFTYVCDLANEQATKVS